MLSPIDSDCRVDPEESMKLVNFTLAAESFSIELIGLGFVWDLHNSGDFLGVNVDSSNNTATMSWKIAGGQPAEKYSGCNLIFGDLSQLAVSARDEDLPVSEDLCVSAISKIIPDQTKELQYRTKREWHEGEPFHLFFEFQSKRSIEIDAETVELVGIVSAHRQSK